MAENDFRDALLRRVTNYQEAEATALRRLRALQEEYDRLRSRSEAAQMLYEAEFGPLPGTGATQSGLSRNAGEAVLFETAADPEVAITRDRTLPRGLPAAAPEGPYTGLPWEVAIEQALRRAGTPLHVREIWAELAEGGFQTEARDPLRSIVAIAVRSPRLVRAGPNTYELVARDREEIHTA